MLADRHFQRPSEHTAVNQFFDLVDGRVHAVERVGEAEPCVEAENIAVLFDRFHHPFAFADRPRHRFLAPDVLAGAGGVDRHDPVPVRRGGDVYDIDVRIFDQFPVVGIGGQFIAGQLLAGRQMIFVHVANGYQAGAGVAVMTASHPADADDALGELIARSRVSRSAEYVTGNDGQGGHSCERFQEIPSFHKFGIF